jgi:endonuclease YncB( thermonuclease family)
MKRLGFLFLMVISAYAVAEEKISGKIKSVIDGNTLEIQDENNETQIVQLAGIDCPELGQEYGDHAKLFLENLVLKKKVTFTITGKDRWGKQLGVVLINDRDVRIEILKEGFAWTAERNAQQEFEILKEVARENSKGLWKQNNPTPPWVYRRQQTMSQPKES